MTAHSVLTSGWTLRLAPDHAADAQGPAAALAHTTVPATVPGCVHTDLLAAGLIPDPFLDENEAALAWVGHTDWRYETRLPPRDGRFECAEVVFDGLDTIAGIAVDGRVIGRTRNMHRAYRFDVSHLPAGHAAELAVEFASAYTEAEALREKLGARPGPYAEPFQYIRKMACSFGWDWGPTLVTAGIWRQARLEQWNTARLDDVRALVTVDGTAGRVEIRAAVRRAPGGADRELSIAVEIAGHSAQETVMPGQDELSLVLEVPDPQLWWPHTLGSQPLYGCEVVLSDSANAEVLDTWHREVGFRTVTLDTAAHADGSAFALAVNGIPVFARGVNWIPEDIFPPGWTPPATAPGSARPPRPAWTWSECGAAGSTRTKPSTKPATSWA